MVIRVLFLAALSLMAHAEFQEEDSVLVLTQSNFDEALKTYPRLLVEFYAPWCGHCKKLAPEYARAAAALKQEDPPIILAKVDATTEPDLASAHQIQGFPTLKFFLNQHPIDFSGGRTAEEITEWVHDRLQPVLKPAKTLAEVYEVLNSKWVVMVLFAAEGAAETEVIEALGHRVLRPHYLHSTDPAALEKFGVKEPSLVLFKQFDDKRVDYTGEFTVEALEAFLEGNMNPLLMPFDDGVIEYIFEKHYKALFIFRSDEQGKTVDDTMRVFGKELKGEFVVSFLDLNLETFANIGAFFGLTAADMPAVVLFDDPNKYALEGAIEEANIREFIAKWRRGELSALVKSQEIPENPEENGVRVLVGKNFESIVFDTTKDVLVEYYAPWCGHCKSFAPEYERLAAELKSESDLIIAKIDYTANEVEGQNVKGFPTLRFFPKNKKAGIDYEEERSVEALTNFIRQHTGRDRTDL